MNRLPSHAADRAADAARSVRRRQLLVILLGLACVVAAWVQRGPLRRLVFERTLRHNDAPAADAVSQMILGSRSPQATLVAAWESGRVVSRQVAVRLLREVVAPATELPPELERIALGGALDADVAVRQAALGSLQHFHHPAHAALAAAQLRDLDPEVRILGLNHLRTLAPDIGVPAVVPLFDDPDPLVMVMGLKLLEQWVGEDFGVELRDVAAFGAGDSGGGETVAKAAAGAERARAWWQVHQGAFPREVPPIPPAAAAAREWIAAPGFTLTDLQGRRVSLGDFRGKVVLLNFWTTWCTACVAEMPVLVALRSQRDEALVILGISLDFVPDSHGHLGGHAPVEEQSGVEVHSEDDGHEREAALDRVRRKVIRTVRTRGINYPILLDEANEAGARYQGGELPTTIMIDAEGRLRRRFVGTRSREVLAAMIEEATRDPQPLSPAR